MTLRPDQKRRQLLLRSGGALSGLAAGLSPLWHGGETSSLLLQTAHASNASSDSATNTSNVRSGGTSSGKAKPRIYMVTWTGKGEVEKGFVDFWQTQKPSAEFIWADAALKPARLAEIKADIERVQPDLVYTWGTQATQAMTGSIDAPDNLIGKRIPLVFAVVADPVAAKITRALVNQDRLIAGVSHVAPLDAQILAMSQYRPIKGVGIIYDPTAANSVANVQAWQAAGARNRFPVVTAAFPVGDNKKLLPASEEINLELVNKIAQTNVNWLYFGPDTFLRTQHVALANAAAQHGLLTFAAVDSMLTSNAPMLMGLVSNFYQIGQFAAFKSQQMLMGEKQVAIEPLQRFSLVIKLATARQLATYPPMGLIDKAEFR